jgi:hypothetical protein
MGLNLEGRIALDGSGWESGLHKVEHLAKHTAAEVGDAFKSLTVQAFGLYGIEQAIEKTFETAKKLSNESKRMGIGVEQLQVLEHAAKEGGSEINAMASAFEKLNIARAKALSGSKEGMHLRDQFRRLGISTDDLRNQTAADLFMGPMSQAAKTRSAEDIGPIFRDVIGKGFGELMPVLQQDFGELHDKMEKLGVLMTGKTVASLTLLEDEIGMLSKIIIVQLGPALLWLVETIYKAFGLLSAWAASFGAATNKMKPGEIAKLATDVINPFGPSVDKLIARLDMPAGAKAWKDTRGAWDAGLAAVKKRIEEEAKRLNHPPIPTFDVPAEPGMSKPKHESRQREAADSLIKVGNFLGSGRDVIQSLAEQQVQLLRQIAYNTRHSTPGGNDSGFGIPPV